MIKLKELINETMAMSPLKHDQWYPAHTRDALQWTLTQNYVPLYPKQIENLFGKIHIKNKSKINKLLTIIIPRHVDRSQEIKLELDKMNLKVHMHSSNKFSS